jgi:Flp pilus assembly protein TadD
MKNFKNFALLILAAAVLSSCGGLNKMVKNADQVVYTVSPEVLEMHGGTVDATVNVQYPAKYFNKKAVLTLTPVVKYDGGETELEPIIVQGESVTENYPVISNATGGSGKVSDSFDYEDKMMKSELFVKISADMKGKTAVFEDVKLADGIVATPSLVAIAPKTLTFSDKFQRVIPEDYVTDIKYKINRADVRKSEVKKEDVAGMTDFLKAANANERVELKNIEVSAYASPDGELDLNTKLSEKRKGTASKYLKGQLKKADIDATEELLSMMSTAEDWEGFKTLMEASEIEDKDMILRVLSMHSDSDVREQEIKNLSAVFEVIAEEILPELRRSKFTVSIDKIGWSDEELLDLWANNADTLNLEELLYSATLVEDVAVKEAIYKKATEVAPKCLRAHNNMGCAQFAQENYDAAESSFLAAKELKDLDIINNNLGAVALINGDLDKAEELFTASLGAGKDVNYNLGIVNIINGKYDEAISYFGSEPSYNAALAIYLSDNSETAMRTVAGLECDCAPKYYLMAVIAADQDKPEVAIENLKLAVERDASLKERAKKDIEFAKLFNDAAFTAVVE